jgi:sodium transport system permease protein
VRWRDVRLLYQRELRAALRERAIVVNSILIPIFLYPLLLWLIFSGMTFVQGLAEGFESRVVVRELPAAHRSMLDSLRAAEGVDVQEGPGGREATLALIREGDLDAFVEFGAPPPEGVALADNFQVRIHYDRSVERSRRARDRVQAVLDRYRGAWIEREVQALGLTRAERNLFRIDRSSVSSERQMGALLLSEMIPLFLVIMVALGCFYPAIDATAGERERSTWETSMTLSASRMSVVIAKYLYVATLGITAGILNVVAMLIAMGAVLEPFFSGQGGGALQFAIPPLAVPLMLVGAVALGLLFAAAMMILAAFARTFREGQGMITPLTWLLFFPLLLSSSPDRTLTPVVALVPVANVTQMIKDAVRGIYLWPLILETLLVDALLVAGCLVVARFVLRLEDLLLGGYDGSFWKFLRERAGKGKGPSARRAAA